MPNLNVQYPSLENIYGPVAGIATGQQFTNAMTNEKLNQDAALQDYLFNQQNNPTKLQQGRANLETTQLANEGTRLKNRFDTDTYDARVKGELSKIAKQLSDDDVAQVKNAIELGLKSQNPQERQLAEQLALATHGVLQERDKLKTQTAGDLEKIHLRGKYDKEVANINASSRLAAANARGSKGGGMKPPKSPKELYAYYAEQARLAESDEEAEKFTQLANDQWSKVIEESVARAAAQNAGDPNLADPRFGIPTQQAPTAQPLRNPRLPPNTPQRQSGVVTNAGSERIRVQSPDGKVGTVPRSQLQQALGQGFKELK